MVLGGQGVLGCWGARGSREGHGKGSERGIGGAISVSCQL